MFLLAAMLNFSAAILHLFIIWGGPKYYRMFGAGEAMASMAEQKKVWPAILTTGIALVLASWGIIALSLSGLIVEIPYSYQLFWAITMVYLIRAMYPFLLYFWVPIFRTRFMVVSSLIVAVFGLVHLLAIMK